MLLLTSNRYSVHRLEQGNINIKPLSMYEKLKPESSLHFLIQHQMLFHLPLLVARDPVSAGPFLVKLVSFDNFFPNNLFYLCFARMTLFWAAL